jgi:hypothetical protein
VTELTFKGKEFVYNHHLSVPFRPLVPHAEKGIGEVDLDGNLIIHGDNLHALKALMPRYAGKVDCIFIDPPYNTGNEGWSYNDKCRNRHQDGGDERPEPAGKPKPTFADQPREGDHHEAGASGGLGLSVRVRALLALGEFQPERHDAIGGPYSSPAGRHEDWTGFAGPVLRDHASGRDRRGGDQDQGWP